MYWWIAAIVLISILIEIVFYNFGKNDGYSEGRKDADEKWIRLIRSESEGRALEYIAMLKKTGKDDATEQKKKKPRVTRTARSGRQSARRRRTSYGHKKRRNGLRRRKEISGA